jgi:TRAP-type C4-dicarboxylate transport system permease small subunit
MAIVDRLTHRIAVVLMAVAGLALMLMMIQMVVDVAMRNFFRRPIEGSLEIVSVYHMVAVVFLPLALVERRHEHITVDLLIHRLSPGTRRAVTVLGYVVCAIFFAVLSYQTLLDALEAFRINEILMSSIYITVWPAKFLLPIGFSLMLVQVLLHAWQAWSQPNFDPSPEQPDLSAHMTN